MAGRRFSICGVIALGVVVAAGCGGRASGVAGGTLGEAGATGEGGDGGPTVMASSWVNELDAAYCSWAARCDKFPDAATCEAYRGPRFAVVDFNVPSAAVLAVSKRTAHFDPRQASTCLSALSSLDCDSDVLRGAPAPVSCATVFSGTVADGGPCIDDVECASSSTCVAAPTATCEGTCTAVSSDACRTNADCAEQQYCQNLSLHGSGLSGVGSCKPQIAPGAIAGAPCGVPVACAASLYCSTEPVPVCTPRAGLGEECGGLNHYIVCAAGLTCVTSDDGAKRTCMPIAKLGEACSSLLQCGAQYALSDLVCDEADTHSCVIRSASGPCTAPDWANTCNPLTTYCDPASGTCKPSLSPGSACEFSADGTNQCGLTASCHLGTCQSFLAGCTPQ